MSQNQMPVGKDNKVTRDGNGDFIYSPISPTEPCLYCGHSECGGGRPYDSAHEPRYCSVCWAESKPGVTGMQSLNSASVDQVSVLEEILQELKRYNELEESGQMGRLPEIVPVSMGGKHYYQSTPPSPTAPPKPRTTRRGL